MARVFIGVGSNVGDRKALLNFAITALKNADHITIQQQSPIYETSPVGGPKQNDYLNQVIEVVTESTPADILALLQDIEQACGRERKIKNGPRTIDCDILLYDDVCINDGVLTIPHPRMHERLFVLQPLADIAPQLIHPTLHYSIAALIKRIENNCGNTQQIKIYIS